MVIQNFPGWSAAAAAAVVLSLLCVSVEAGQQCRCVPDQWQGILSSLEREFDLEGGRTATNENNIYVYYDYVNKKFAMREVNSGSTAIADYKGGYKYVIQGDYCHGIKMEEPMSQMCLPDDAEQLGDFVLGDDVPVSIWQFSAPYNLTMKTTVIQKRCVPISEEVFLQQGSYASVTSSLYLDVEMGIKDESVFQPPADCEMADSFDEHDIPRKRSRHDKDLRLLKALRNRLYIFN